MKKKKIKKLAKLILKEVQSLKKYETKIRERVDYAPFDKEVSDKTKNLILQLIQYDENVKINLSEDSFNISTYDITAIKKPVQKNTPINEDNYLEIYVVKDEGFSINLAYAKRSHYEDEKIYNELFDVVSHRVIENSKVNFTEIWNRVVKESGIMRDNNLNDLFDE